MPPSQMIIIEPHVLRYEDALARLRRMGAYLAKHHGLKVEWDRTKEQAHVTGKVMIIEIDVTCSVLSGEVKIEGKDPGPMWRTAAELFLRNALTKYLDPSLALAQLPSA